MTSAPKNIQQIVKQIKTPVWSESFDALQQQVSRVNLSNSDKKYIERQIEYHFQKRHSGRATNWVLLYIVVDPTKAVSKLQKKGFFRPSFFDFNHTCAYKVLTELVSPPKKLDQKAKQYLQKMKILSELGFEVQKELQALLKDLRRGGILLFRDIFASLDFAFMLQATDGFAGDPAGSTDQLETFSPEEMAEAFSYLVYVYHKHSASSLSRFLPSYSRSQETADNALTIAAKIRAFQEFEILVDAMQYEIAPPPKTGGAYTVYTKDKELEVATRLGYFMNNQQRIAFHKEFDDDKAVSIREWSEQAYKGAGGKLTEYLSEPMRRYRFMFPLTSEFKAFLNKEELFAEEAGAFSFAQREWRVTHDRLREFRVTDEITIWDLVKVQRQIGLMRWIAVSRLRPIVEEDTELVLNSLVASMKTVDLTQLLEGVVGDKASKIVDFLTWDSSKNGVFDVQYQPLVKVGKYHNLPYNLFGNSDVLRNSFQLSKRRLYEDGTEDPLVDSLYEALKQRTDYVVKK